MESINLKTWQEVSYFLDEGFWRPSPTYFEHIIQHKTLYPTDAFSKGQLASKSWLLKVLYSVILEQHKINYPLATTPNLKNIEVAILGSWIGAIVEPLHQSFQIDRIYGIDIDSKSIELSEKLNQRYVQDNWKYKGVVADVNNLNCGNMEFETGGELIQTKPDWIINTSCEHMNTDWFDTVADDQLIIMQTNNNPDFEGHTNTSCSIQEMENKYPLTKSLYKGELITPSYTRFMQIGYK